MKGWVLCENNKIICNSLNGIDIFKTKLDLLDAYGGALGDLNNIRRVDIKLK